MYIYCITNKVNDKKYVGSTNDPDRRKKEHFQSARLESCPSYDYPLQKAIRKYGEDKFEFSILEECCEDKTAQMEKDYIIRLDTITNTGHGYNQTLFTDCALRDPELKQRQKEKNGTKCAIVDENNNIIRKFISYHEAASETYGGKEATPIRRVCDGERYSENGYIFRKLDEEGSVIIPAQQTRKRRTAVVGISKQNPEDKVFYESVSEAARQNNICRASISKCIAGSTKYSQVGGRIWRKD